MVLYLSKKKKSKPEPEMRQHGKSSSSKERMQVDEETQNRSAEKPDGPSPTASAQVHAASSVQPEEEQIKKDPTVEIHNAAPLLLPRTMPLRESRNTLTQASQD